MTDTKQYSDYIPEYIDQMDTIVTETYERTRGELYLRLLLISVSEENIREEMISIQDFCFQHALS